MKEERKMKIKKIGIFILVILSIISVALFASCKKKNKSPILPQTHNRVSRKKKFRYRFFRQI